MKYVRFDEIENVLSSLEMMAHVARFAKKKSGLAQWKWLLVGAHDSIQGAIVCAIADSTGTNILSKKSAAKVLNWLEDRSKNYSDEYMADFKTLLKRTGVVLATSESKDIRKLHSFRNDFAHFTPKTWSIELAGLPRIITVALKLVEHFMNADRVLLQLSGNRKRRLSRSLGEIRSELRLG